MRFTSLALGFTAASTALAADCSSTGQYNDIPGFPAFSKGCIPTGYFQTSDLGNTNPADAKTRCQASCNNYGSQCAGYLAQVNKAADSNLYSGTCFFYDAANLPTQPRSCANTLYEIIGQRKDATLQCFSSSSAAAYTYCSSLRGFGTVTTTKTISAATSTTTTTQISSTTTSSTLTSLTTTTSTSSVTSTAPAVTTTTFTTSSSTSLVANHKRAAATSKPPACVSSGTPVTRLSSACDCISITSKTKTVTITQTASTQTSTQSLTTTATSLTTTQSTISTTLVTTLTTVTPTSTSTSIVAATTVVPENACTQNNPGAPFYNICAGSPKTCFCYLTTSGHGFCAAANYECGTTCSTDADCPGSACIQATQTGCNNQNTCATTGDMQQCGTGSSYTKRRMFFSRDLPVEKANKFNRRSTKGWFRKEVTGWVEVPA